MENGNVKFGPLYGMCTSLHTAPLRLAALRSVVWDPGQAITIGWMGGNKFLWDNVMSWADMWRAYANINFEWVGETRDAMVRIAFKEGEGSWSYLGKQVLHIPNTTPTMNFGWFDKSTSSEEFRRTTVHEFGHMLGMIHEHQHPTHGILWNRPAVYEAYEKSMGWSKLMVDTQVFGQYSEDLTQYSEFDPNSIMCYHIPSEFTLNEFTNGWNTRLSLLDKSWAEIIYPGRRKGIYLPSVCTQ